MSEERERFLVAAMLKPVEVGQQFSWIPPHMTIVRWFYFENHRYHFLEYALEQLSNPAYFEGVQADGRAKFGPQEDIPATTLKNVNPIPNYGLSHLVEGMGEFKDNLFNEYRPHVSDTADFRLKPGGEVSFCTVALVSKMGKTGVNTIRWAKQLKTGALPNDEAAA